MNAFYKIMLTIKGKSNNISQSYKKSLRFFSADFSFFSIYDLSYLWDQPGATSSIRSNEARAAFATCSGT